MEVSPATASPVTNPAHSPAIQDKASKPRATTGEKWFSAIRFITGESVILFTTAVIAYIAHPNYGKDKYGPVPNVLKTFQGWLYDKMPNAAVKVLPFKDHISRRIGLAFASTTLLMHGGNVFAPVMKKIEDSKEHIVTYLNRHFGKPGEVEAGKARLNKEPKQNWGDIIKGRLLSWLFVFVSFVGADAVLGKDSAGKYKFDKFEETFGKWVASFTAKGKEAIAAGTFAENKSFRFGKILALDIYATAAALLIWIGVSKFSAANRARKANKPERDLVEIASDITIREQSPAQGETRQKPFAEAASPQPKRGEIMARGTNDFRSRTENTAMPEMAL